MSSLPLNASPASSFPAELTNIATAFPIKPQGEKRAAVLKHIARSGRLVAVRPASQLEVRPQPEMLSMGIAELDALTGGIPRGCLTELCGSPSSGKTSVLIAVMASASRREESCVLIDASDSFDPSSGAAAGMDFNKLLWVRCGKRSSVVGRPSSAKTSSFVVRCTSWAKPDHLTGLNSANEERPTSNNDGFADDQRPTTDDLQRISKKMQRGSEHRLNQVLKTTDLILQSGGFGLVALDLAGIPEKFVRRIPLASWFRFQRAVEHTKSALLVISEFTCAQTCATLAIKTTSSRNAAACESPAWQRREAQFANAESREGWNLRTPSHTQVLEGMQIEVEILRSRLERKPTQSETTVFRTQAVRAG
jgi:recombination protein RecA